MLVFLLFPLACENSFKTFFFRLKKHTQQIGARGFYERPNTRHCTYHVPFMFKIIDKKTNVVFLSILE